MSGSVRCPQCGHVLFAIELPVALAVQAWDAEASLLVRVRQSACASHFRKMVQLFDK
jgi:hypothetical protein